MEAARIAVPGRRVAGGDLGRRHQLSGLELRGRVARLSRAISGVWVDPSHCSAAAGSGGSCMTWLLGIRGGTVVGSRQAGGCVLLFVLALWNSGYPQGTRRSFCVQTAARLSYT